MWVVRARGMSVQILKGKYRGYENHKGSVALALAMQTHPRTSRCFIIHKGVTRFASVSLRFIIQRIVNFLSRVRIVELSKISTKVSA